MATKLAEAGDKEEQVMDMFTSDERRDLDGTTVREICTSWLRDLGYDGLCMPGCCGCGLDDLMPCQEPSPECQCAYEGRGLPGSEFEPEDIVYYTNKADARRSLLLAKGVINGRD